MKRWLKIFFLAMLLYLLCNTSAYASAGISKLTKTVSPTVGTGDTITITTADKFCLRETEKTLVYFQIEGLDIQSNNFYVEINLGNEQHQQIIPSEVSPGICYFPFRVSELENFRLNAIHTIDLSVFDISESIVYDVSFDIQITESIIPNNIVSFDKVYTSGNDGYIYLDILSSDLYDNLTAKIVGSDNTVYSFTDDVSSEHYYEKIIDKRYADVFCEEISNLIDISTNYYSFNFKQVRPLDNGDYSIAFFDGNTEKYRIENAVTCTDLPLINARQYSEDVPLTKGGDTEGLLYVTLDNGNIDDFTFTLVDENGNNIARNTGEYVQTQDAYIVKIKTTDGKTFISDNSYKINITSEKEFYPNNIHYSSNFYVEDENSLNYKEIYTVKVPDYKRANFVLYTTGFSADVRYKIELEDENNNQVIQTYAFPDENGVFDVEFLTSDNTPYPMENYSSYSVKIYFQTEWGESYDEFFYDSDFIEAEDDSTNDEEVTYPEISGSMNINYDAAHIYLYVRADIMGKYSDDSLFKLQATGLDGSIYALSNVTSKRWMINNSNQEYIHLEINIGNSMPYGYYTFKLFYNSEEVNAGNNNICRNNTLFYSNDIDVAWTINYVNDLCFAESFHIYRLSGNPTVTLKLYDTDVRNTVPLHTITLEKGEDCYYIPQNTQFDIFRAYNRQLYADGKLICAYFTTEGEYYVPNNYEADDTLYEIKIAQIDNGTLSLSKTMAKKGEIVYVQNNPAEGYELVPLSVSKNGSKINGRAFIVDGSATVSAQFREIKTSKYNITVSQNIYDGTVTLSQASYFAGDTVTVSATADDNFALEELYYNDLNGNPVNIPIDTCSFIMPQYDIIIYATFSYKNPYYIWSNNTDEYTITLNGGTDNYITTGTKVEIGLSFYCGRSADFSVIESAYYTLEGEEGTQYPISNGYFIMPSQSINLYVTPKRRNITIEITGYGDLYCSTQQSTWTTNYISSAIVGQTVSVTCGEMGSFSFVAGTLKLNGNALNTDKFIMPDSDVIITAEFSSDLYKNITVSDSENGSAFFFTDDWYSDGADVGDMVYVDVLPDYGYRLASLKYNDTLIVQKNDFGTYYFVMPDEDVSIKAVFELDEYKVTFKNWDGSVIAEISVPNGASVEYQGITPYKPIDSNYAYEFKGWDVDLSFIAQDTIAVAQFDSIAYTKIYTEAQLNEMRNNLAGYYVLMNDITLNSPWEPIGSKSWSGDAFCGTFDGNMHVIKNIIIPEVYDLEYIYPCYGFFNRISDATIRNLGLEISYGGENDFHDSETRIGGLAARAYDCIIERVYTRGNITSSASYLNSIGGFVCEIYGGITKDCYSDVNITAKGPAPAIGGFVSFAPFGSIENCYSNSTITLVDVLTDVNDIRVGGFVDSNVYALTGDSARINNCFYNSDRYVYNDNSLGVGVSAERLKDVLTFCEVVSDEGNSTYNHVWDFETIWSINDNINDGFPNLRFTDTPLEIYEVGEVIHNADLKRIELRNVTLSKYKRGKVMLAAYAGDKMVGFDVSYSEHGFGEYIKQMDFELIYTQKPDCVRIMFWDGFHTLNPLCLPIDVDIF